MKYEYSTRSLGLGSGLALTPPRGWRTPLSRSPRVGILDGTVAKTSEEQRSSQMKKFAIAFATVGLVSFGSGLASTAVAVAAENGSAADTIAELEAGSPRSAQRIVERPAVAVQGHRRARSEQLEPRHVGQPDRLGPLHHGLRRRRLPQRLAVLTAGGGSATRTPCCLRRSGPTPCRRAPR